MAVFNHKAMFETIRDKNAVKIRFKDESRWMKILSPLMVWCPTFMTEFTTTLGETIYFPSRKWLERDYSQAWEILCHELVHIRDYRASKPRWLFSLKYAFPHWLALLAILAPILWSFWPLLALVFLAPIPSFWRCESELRGYAMTMAVWYWYRGSGIPVGLKQDIVDYLSGPSYYFSWPFKASLSAKVDRWSKQILTGEVTDPLFLDIKSEIESARANKR